MNFAGGMSGVVSALNAAFGSNLQFSNIGTVLHVVNAASTTNVVNSLSATSTVTSLTSGNSQLPLFLDGSTADHRRAHRRQVPRPRVLPGASRSIPRLPPRRRSLVAYASNTAAGDPTRPNFILNQMTALR